VLFRSFGVIPETTCKKKCRSVDVIRCAKRKLVRQLAPTRRGATDSRLERNVIPKESLILTVIPEPPVVPSA